MKKPVVKKTVKATAPQSHLDFAFTSENYKLMIIGFAIIVIGFALMCGGDEDIYSFRKITLSVIVSVAGYIFTIYAIMKRPKA